MDAVGVEPFGELRLVSFIHRAPFCPPIQRNFSTFTIAKKRGTDNGKRSIVEKLHLKVQFWNVSRDGKELQENRKTCGGTRRSRKGEVTAEDRKGSRYRPAVCIYYHKKKGLGCQVIFFMESICLIWHNSGNTIGKRRRIIPWNMYRFVCKKMI